MLQWRNVALRPDLDADPLSPQLAQEPGLHARGHLHYLHLLLPAGMSGVDDVEQEIRSARLLERGAERSDQMVRQLADEADGVGDAEPVPSADIDLAGEGIERREQPILDEDVGTGERAQDARLSRVGIAHEGGAGEVAATLSLVGAVVGHAFKPTLQNRDLAADDPAVGLELGFAGTPQPDATTDSREVGPHAREAWQQEIGRAHV